jgi:YfiR/HmsC-like
VTFHNNSEFPACQCWSNRIGPRFACTVALLTWGWAVPFQSIYAQEAPTEYQVKAAYLFNFLKFVEWPGDPIANTNGHWVIGIVGDNPFGDDLTQIISGKTVQGHELLVRRFQPGEDLHACHVLFISASEKKRLPSLLAALSGSSVLTVGDTDHFIESGGMIQFVMEEKRVRFGIDVRAAGRARLKVSSKLLSLARTVTGAEQVGNN